MCLELYDVGAGRLDCGVDIEESVLWKNAPASFDHCQKARVIRMNLSLSNHIDGASSSWLPPSNPLQR